MVNYNDAVVNPAMDPLFSGRPHEIVKWLKENPYAGEGEDDRGVVKGYTMQVIPVQEYLEQKKHEAVKQLVAQAIIASKNPDARMSTLEKSATNRFAGNVADSILKELERF